MGIRSANDELLLAKSNNGVPAWKSLLKKRSVIHESDIRRHITILIG
jgi:primosomal replication protein N